MSEPNDLPEPATDRRDPERPRTPPKRIPWPFTILLLLLLPALVVGVWLGGAFHKADDRPVAASRRPTPGYVPKPVAPMTPPTPAPAPAPAPARSDPGPAAPAPPGAR